MSEGEKLISTNPIARQNYFIEEVVEAGLVLVGTEVKSMRQSSPNLRDAFVEVRGKPGGLMEAYLLNAHVAPYSHGNLANHEPLRKRKLLLHRHQIEKLFGYIIKDGRTVIPTKLYFKNGKVKIELGIAKGKKKHDKRQDVKKKSADMEMKKAMKRNR